jgi:hypothetical protein
LLCLDLEQCFLAIGRFDEIEGGLLLQDSFLELLREKPESSMISSFISRFRGLLRDYTRRW